MDETTAVRIREDMRVFAVRVTVTLQGNFAIAVTQDDVLEWRKTQRGVDWIQEADLGDSRLWCRTAERLAEDDLSDPAGLEEGFNSPSADATEIVEWDLEKEIWVDGAPITGQALRQKYPPLDTHGEPLMEPLKGQMDFEGGMVS